MLRTTHSGTLFFLAAFSSFRSQLESIGRSTATVVGPKVFRGDVDALAAILLMKQYALLTMVAASCLSNMRRQVTLSGGAYLPPASRLEVVSQLRR